MPGQIKRMIDEIIRKRSKGDPTIVSLTKTKLILKGVDPDKFTSASEDNPAMIDRLRTIAVELQVQL